MRRKNARLAKNPVPKLSTAAQGVLLAGFLLVAFAVFLSQVTPLFAKAVSSNIRGSMVLLDKPPIQWTGTGYLYIDIYNSASVALPGTTCNVQITACDFTVTTGGTSSPALYFNGALNAPGGVVGTSCTTGPKIANVAGGIYTVTAQGTYNGGYSMMLESMSLAYDCTP